MPPRVLSIAGSDSGGGAGIQADLKTITMLGGYATTALTAVTAQNTVGVDAIEVLAPALVLAQVDAVVGDLGVDAVKVGMVGSAAIAEALAARLRAPDLAAVPLVFDPVMVASTGAVLADPATAFAFARLLTRATVATPNLAELGALAGGPVGNEEEALDAAAHLVVDRGTGAILVTGIPSDDGGIADLLVAPDGGEVAVTRWVAPRLPTDQDHGTGCTLSSAIACGLARGLALDAAIGDARNYVRAVLAAAPGLGRGHGPMGHALGRRLFP